MRFGWVRFYADENVDEALVRWLRRRRYRVDTACELGLAGRDDKFHLQEARRRKAVLLTNDRDFLDHRRFPFAQLKDTAIVVLSSGDKSMQKAEYGYMLYVLNTEVGPSGNRGLKGMKLEIKGFRVVLYGRMRGRVRTDEFDFSKPQKTRTLFPE